MGKVEGEMKQEKNKNKRVLYNMGSKDSSGLASESTNNGSHDFNVFDMTPIVLQNQNICAQEF